MKTDMINIFTVLLLITGLNSCKDSEKFSLPKQASNNEFVAMKEIFGFYPQKRYAYAPSIVKDDKGVTHMYFCGNPDDVTPGSTNLYQSMVDNIYHIKISADGSQSVAKSVLQPTANTFDSHHTCDPSVIAGEFKMKGVSYKYAMFFLGNRLDRYYNEVGVAFSNDLDANAWVKYDKQVVEKTWVQDEDLSLGNNIKAWGVGQPTAVSLDKKGKVLLGYTIGDNISTRIGWTEIDLSNMDNFTAGRAVNMVQTGLKQLNGKDNDYTANVDFAIDVEKKIIMMIRPVHPHPADYPNFLNKSLEINYLPLDAFKASVGTWKTLIRITPETTGYPRNHNAGFERNEYGEIANWEQPKVYYTISKASPDTFIDLYNLAEWSYRIWSGEVRNK